MRILTIGAATQDVIIGKSKAEDTVLLTHDDPYSAFHQGAAVEVEQLSYAIGGGAVNSALSFKRQGYDVTTFFKKGNDPQGSQIVRELERSGITVTSVTSATMQTGTSFVLPSLTTDGITFTYRGANALLEKAELPPTLFDHVHAVYISSLTHQAAGLLPDIVSRAHKKVSEGIFKVAVNPGIGQLTKYGTSFKASLSFIDVLIVSAYEMQLIMKLLKPRFFKSHGTGTIPDGPPLARGTIAYEKITFTLYEYCKELFSYGIKRLVVTGNDGVYVATKDQLLYHPLLTTIASNTRGISDAFDTGFVGALLSGTVLEDALCYGMINARSVAHAHDVTAGLLTKAQMHNQLEEQVKTEGKNMVRLYDFGSTLAMKGL